MNFKQSHTAHSQLICHTFSGEMIIKAHLRTGMHSSWRFSVCIICFTINSSTAVENAGTAPILL